MTAYAPILPAASSRVGWSSYDPGHVWVVIPAFNEAAMIGEVVAGVRPFFANVVVIDDHSADDTSACAARAGAHALRHPFNLGQGAALQTGIDYALARGAQHVVTFDADGQHHIEDVPEMLETLIAHDADLVLGSRFLGTTVGMHRSRRALLAAATLFTRLTTGLALTDCHNGLRVLSARAARTIRLRQNRMAHASELLAAIRRHRLHYVEAPVTISYTSYSRAKGQKMGDALAILRDLVAARLSA